MTATLSDNRSERLPLALCLGFGVGTIGVSIMLNTVTAYFPAFLTTVLGRSPEIAGYLLMASKLYDAFADVAVGSMSDRTRSRWGRRRPYLLAGAFVSALSFLMIFMPPQLSDTAVTLYMLAALVLYSTGYSLFNVPYIAMPSEMTSSMYERSRLLSFRTVFVSIGQLAAIAGTASIISWGGGGARGYMIMGLVMALVILTTMSACFFGTASARQIQAKEGGERVDGSQLRLMLRNRPFVLLVGAKIFQFLAFASSATTSLLFMLNVLHVGYLGQMYFAITANLVVAGSMPAWLWLERLLGKRNAYMVGIACMCVVSLSWMLTGAGISTLDLVLRAVIAGFGSGGMLLLSNSMLGDTLAYDRELTGRTREGLLSSVIAVIEKTSFAAGAAVIGVLLNLANYVPTRDGRLIEQPQSATDALYISFAVLPAVMFVANAVCIYFYPLGSRRGITPASSGLSGAAPRSGLR